MNEEDDRREWILSRGEPEWQSEALFGGTRFAGEFETPEQMKLFAEAFPAAKASFALTQGAFYARVGAAWVTQKQKPYLPLRVTIEFKTQRGTITQEYFTGSREWPRYNRDTSAAHHMCEEMMLYCLTELHVATGVPFQKESYVAGLHGQRVLLQVNRLPAGLVVTDFLSADGKIRHEGVDWTAGSWSPLSMFLAR